MKLYNSVWINISSGWLYLKMFAFDEAVCKTKKKKKEKKKKKKKKRKNVPTTQKL